MTVCGLSQVSLTYKALSYVFSLQCKTLSHVTMHVLVFIHVLFGMIMSMSAVLAVVALPPEVVRLMREF